MNKLDIKITNITSHNAFKNCLLSVIRPFHFRTFKIDNPVRLQFLTKLQIALSYLNEH